jgi:excisionase family DNA binding protein
MKLISTDEAAECLGVSGRRVRQLIDEGKLPAQYVGGGYVIDEAALAGVKVYGKPGRPPKPKAEARPTKDRGTIASQTETTRKLDQGVKRAADGAMGGKKKGGVR